MTQIRSFAIIVLLGLVIYPYPTKDAFSYEKTYNLSSKRHEVIEKISPKSTYFLAGDIITIKVGKVWVAFNIKEEMNEDLLRIGDEQDLANRKLQTAREYEELDMLLEACIIYQELKDKEKINEICEKLERWLPGMP